MLEQEPTYGDPNWQEIPCPYPVCDAFWDHPHNVMYTRYDAELLTGSGCYGEAENYGGLDIWSPYNQGAGFIPLFSEGEYGTCVWLPEPMWQPLRDHTRGYKLRGTLQTDGGHTYDRIGNRWGSDSAGVWHYPSPGSAVRMHGCKLHEQEVFVGGHTHVIEWFMYYFGFGWDDCMCSQLPGGGQPPSGNCPGTNWQVVPSLTGAGVALAALYKDSSVVFGQQDSGYPNRDEAHEALAFVYVNWGGNRDFMISHCYTCPMITPSGAIWYAEIPYYSGPLSLVDRGWHWTYNDDSHDIYDDGPLHKAGFRMLFPWDEPYPEAGP